MRPLLMGFAFGYLGSMPVAGPISILILHLGLAHDSRRALGVAAGAALAEAIYVLLAFWGMSALLVQHPLFLPVSRAAGAVVFLGLGLALMRTPGAPPRNGRGQPKGHPRSLVLGFLLTAVNPTLIVTWTAAVAALGTTGLLDLNRQQALPFAAAAGTGIVAWFATLLWLVGKCRNRVSAAALVWFRRGLGAVLVTAGGWWAGGSLIRLLAALGR